MTEEVERLEATYDKHRLAELIQPAAWTVAGPAPAHDETPKRVEADGAERRTRPSSRRRPARSSSATTGRS